MASGRSAAVDVVSGWLEHFGSSSAAHLVSATGVTARRRFAVGGTGLEMATWTSSDGQVAQASAAWPLLG
ncbi:MAG: hypothetical protein GY788_03225 [bacterium]|nr:hypothetical protein [bacterium]